MIYKHENYKNGYIFAPSSTNADLQNILEKYDKISCIICNAKTIHNFYRRGNITINNHIADGCFFVNTIC